MERFRILCSDVDQHPAFFRFVDTVFHGARTEPWTVWRDRSGWTRDYEVFAILRPRENPKIDWRVDPDINGISEVRSFRVLTWTEYITDDGNIVSTIGRTRLHMVVDGKDRVGYQLGAVATLESYRRQGLARRLMEWMIDELDKPDQPIILFANNSVLDFYPRFGFRRIPQQRSFASAAL